MMLSEMRPRNCVVLLVFALAVLTPAVLGGSSSKAVEEPRTLAIEMGAPFQDHAILQRGMKVPVWGWSKAGTVVTVRFSGQTRTATAGKDGKWVVELEPLAASSEPAEMVIAEEGGKTETLKDVLVGEVWLASGQSNMQWLAGKCNVNDVIRDIHKRIKAGEEEMPRIREVQIPRFASSLSPREKAKASWSTNWTGFSAIAFAFAYEIQKELKVPVGIVNCSYSSTPIQAWVHRDGYRDGKDGFTRDVYQKILEADFTSLEHKVAWDSYYTALRAWTKEAGKAVDRGWSAPPMPSRPGNLRGNRDAAWLHNGKTHPMVPFAIRGVIWNQGYANFNDGIVYRNYLHSLVRSFRLLWSKSELPVYYHQFYALGGPEEGMTLSSVSEMRLGTWLAHREIQNTAMASQIDITGGVHYRNKTVPGRRLALHALKNQYGRKIIANGPMYKGYTVKGPALILQLAHAEGLTVAQPDNSSGFVVHTPIENGEDQVKLFYLAGKDLQWHQARVRIVGETIELTAPGLKEPCGVAYGCNGVGSRPAIYNKAMLPLTPFVYFDHKLVVSRQWKLEQIAIPDHPLEMMTWPLDYIPLADREIDPTTYGLMSKHGNLALLSPQFRDGGVIQAGVPTRMYGAGLPGSVVKVTFAGMERTVEVGPHQSEWEATFDALPANAEPTTIHATCTLGGKLAHERTVSNIVIGDVWYVFVNNAAMPDVARYPKYTAPTGPVRMFQSHTKKGANAMPDRFKLTVSGAIKSRFYARWVPPAGLAKELGDRIHATAQKPVGVIVMNTSGDVAIKELVGYKWLGRIPAWKDDAEQLRRKYSPDPRVYEKGAEDLIQRWQAYWNRCLTEASFSTSSDSGSFPRFQKGKSPSTPATMRYNLILAPYGPANFKGVLCFSPKSFMGDDEGASFGPAFAAMANCWKETFACGRQVLDPHFVFTLPGKALAARISVPGGIQGASTGVAIDQWPQLEKKDPKTRQPVIGEDVKAVLEAAVKAVYK